MLKNHLGRVRIGCKVKDLHDKKVFIVRHIAECDGQDDDCKAWGCPGYISGGEHSLVCYLSSDSDAGDDAHGLMSNLETLCFGKTQQRIDRLTSV